MGGGDFGALTAANFMKVNVNAWSRIGGLSSTPHGTTLGEAGRLTQPRRLQGFDQITGL